MTKVIISPVNKIRHIINNLGRGIIQKIDHPANGDEIGKMVQSVNNLSEKLLATATFAHETGLRNFDMPYKPLSDEDTLGKALLSMRENLKTGEANLAMQNKELEQKNKELEQFAYVASHDMQEPLRTTSSFVSLLQQQYKGKLDEKADKYLTFITQSSDRMQVLIKDSRRCAQRDGIPDSLAGLALRARGVPRLSLGLAPLSGLSDGGSGAERAVHFLYEHLNRFYSFQGVRQFKEKFRPEWEPRYLIYPGVTELPRIGVALARADSGENLVSYFRKSHG